MWKHNISQPGRKLVMAEITVVHVTHEVEGKIGGIGAVLQGFFTCNPYLDIVERSILVGPLFTTEGSVSDRLGEKGKVLYSSVGGIVNTGYAPAFRRIEDFYSVAIVYGRREFVDQQTEIKSTPEVLLIDVTQMDNGPVNKFKKQLFEEFGIQSHLYEHLWEYEQYIRLAPATIAALKAIGAAASSTTIIAHEFMGIPIALAAILEPSCDFKTLFYAHEVATMRRIIEKHPGHDTMFYNVIRSADENGLYVGEVFGNQSSFFKHALIETSDYCDTICAVGDYVVDELRFLGPAFGSVGIDIVYNGIPACQITTADKLTSKEKLRRYCENLLGFKPDFIFTHVTRLVRSKGLWRDLQVLEHAEEEFKTQGRTAVLLLLSTDASQRRIDDICGMESAYNWPVAHREGLPDLSAGEADFYTKVQEFNVRSRNIKIIFVNQFGFEPKNCGSRMPEDVEFMDIRKGSDVEFGLSIYEPFGISQLEALTFGAICVLSSACGCAGFLRDVVGEKSVANIIIADYINLDLCRSSSHTTMRGGNDTVIPEQADIKDLMQIDSSVRSRIEASESKKVARQIIQRLPKSESEIENMIQVGYSLAKNMSWDVVVKNYLLPSLQKAMHEQPVRPTRGAFS